MSWTHPLCFDVQQAMSKVSKQGCKQANINTGRIATDKRLHEPAENQADNRKGGDEEEEEQGTDLVPEVVVPHVAGVSQHAAPEAGVHLDAILKPARGPIPLS